MQDVRVQWKGPRYFRDRCAAFRLSHRLRAGVRITAHVRGIIIAIVMLIIVVAILLWVLSLWLGGDRSVIQHNRVHQ